MSIVFLLRSVKIHLPKRIPFTFDRLICHLSQHPSLRNIVRGGGLDSRRRSDASTVQAIP